MASTERKHELYSAEFRADPYRVFAQMREHDPVFCQPGIDGETMIWFVTRYDDVAAVLVDDERFVRDPRLALTEEELAGQELPPMLQAIDNHMLNRDGDGPPPPAPARDEGIHAQGGRAAARTDPGDRG